MSLAGNAHGGGLKNLSVKLKRHVLVLTLRFTAFSATSFRALLTFPEVKPMSFRKWLV